LVDFGLGWLFLLFLGGAYVASSGSVMILFPCVWLVICFFKATPSLSLSSLSVFVGFVVL